MSLRFIRKTFVSAFLVSLAVTLTPNIAQADTAQKDKPSISALAVPKGEQRYIVKYHDAVDAQAESNALQQQGIDVKDTISNVMKGSVVVASPNEIDSLKTSSNVESIEIDHPISITGATSVWGLDRIDQRTGRDGQYSVGDEGSGVNVYVVDSGIYFNHSEFTGRIIASWYGIGDGNGANDCNGHGTHVAGTIGGTTYGVAKKANIIPVRILECDGSGWSSTVISGLDWIIAHHQAGQPAVVNMSIGGFSSASLDQSVRNVINDGITVVAAAGNSNVDACTSAPASVVPAITVAATDVNDNQASFSNYGSCVDIQAPGVNILSSYNNAPTGYNTLSGTSMAAPHVSGAAAVLLSRNRAMTPAQVHQTMIDNATVGVIKGIKGSTPNRMLFIPALNRTVSCANLQMGDAWAGVGSACGLGKSAGIASSESTITTSTATGSAGSVQSVETPSVPTAQSAVAPVESTPVKETVIEPLPEQKIEPQKETSAIKAVESVHTSPMIAMSLTTENNHSDSPAEGELSVINGDSSNGEENAPESSETTSDGGHEVSSSVLDTLTLIGAAATLFITLSFLGYKRFRKSE